MSIDFKPNQSLFDINFSLNYSICKRTLDGDGKNISVPMHCNSHGFLYHLESESLEKLMEELKQKIIETEILWTNQNQQNIDLPKSRVQIVENP